MQELIELQSWRRIRFTHGCDKAPRATTFVMVQQDIKEGFCEERREEAREESRRYDQESIETASRSNSSTLLSLASNRVMPSSFRPPPLLEEPREDKENNLNIEEMEELGSDRHLNSKPEKISDFNL